jgi:hypothetical protein
MLLNYYFHKHWAQDLAFFIHRTARDFWSLTVYTHMHITLHACMCVTNQFSELTISSLVLVIEIIFRFGQDPDYNIQ